MSLIDLRKSLLLSRQQVADSINRSPNFILKAEQATFPTPPPALLNFYKHRLGASVDLDLEVASYYQTQHSRRKAWLSQWQPVQQQQALNFRRCWVPLPSGLPLSEVGESVDGPSWVFEGLVEAEPPEPPTQYALSQGLCLPAAVVYRLETNNQLGPHSPVLTVSQQLVAYVESGEYYATEGYSEATQQVASNLLALHDLLQHRVKRGRQNNNGQTAGPAGPGSTQVKQGPGDKRRGSAEVKQGPVRTAALLGADLLAH